MLSNIIKRYDFAGFKSHIKNTNNINKAGLSSASILFLIALFAILPFVPHMDGAEASKTPIDYNPPLISVEIASSTASLDLVPTKEGSFASSSEDDLASFSVTSSSFSGYTLSVLSDNDNGELLSTDPNNDNKLNTINSILDEETFKAGNLYNGKWGFKPNKYINNENEVVDNTTEKKYLPSPTTDGTVIDVTIDNTVPTNEYTIALGARANHSLQYGTYAKTFTLAAVANPSKFNITFEDTSEDPTVSNIPAPISSDSVSATASIDLPDTIPTRDNFTFKGWCTGVPEAAAFGNTCPDTAEFYTAGSTYYLDQTENNIQTLYAIWGLDTYNLTITFAGEGVESVQVRTAAGTEGELIGTVTNSGDAVENLEAGQTYYLYPSFSFLHKLQDWSANNITISDTTSENPAITGSSDGSVTITGRNMTLQEFGRLRGTNLNNAINAMADSTEYTLIDSRDNQAYTVAKLKDGNIWMSNLNLGDTENHPLVVSQLDSTNTNLTGNAASNTIDTSIFSSTEDDGWRMPSGSYSRSYTEPKYISVAGIDSTSQTPYGTLYNYCAASAGTICTDTITKNATSDLCPAGWRLPTGDDSGEFARLYANSAYNTSAKMRAPISEGGAAFAFAGSYAGALSNHGVYWSSTWVDHGYDYNNMSRLYLDSSSVEISNSSRISTYSIRCIVNTSLDGTTLQDFNTMTKERKYSVKNSMKTDVHYTLKDNRDNQEYTIAKLADGNVWMTKNLNLGDTENYPLVVSQLDSTNTNLRSINVIAASTFSSTESGGWKKIRGSSTYTAPEYIPVAGIYGTLYNYCAASAGTICKESNSNSATSDLCPAGWRLPTGGSSGQFATLIDVYDGGMLSLGYGPAFNRAGYFAKSTPVYQGSQGYYWSSRRHDSTGMNILYIGASGISANDDDFLDRDGGYSIRCILK